MIKSFCDICKEEIPVEKQGYMRLKAYLGSVCIDECGEDDGYESADYFINIIGHRKCLIGVRSAMLELFEKVSGGIDVSGSV